MTREIERLQHALGHSFANPELLARALTHASALDGRRGSGESYQQLEFLGDRVLGLVVADLLVQHYPEAPEGELSRRLARLVSREACAEIAGEMSLQDYLRTGSKGTVRATPNVLSDVCEAVIAATYRDGGLAAARALVERYWGARIEGMSGPLRDAKTELQEWAHRRGFEPPVYRETLRSGPDHAPHFEIEVAVGNIEAGRGQGGSKREAEQDAAASLLRREGVWGKM